MVRRSSSYGSSSRTRSSYHGTSYYGGSSRNRNDTNDEEMDPGLSFALMLMLMVMLCILTIMSYPLVEIAFVFLSQILRINFKKWGNDILIIILSLIGFAVSLVIPAGLSASLYFAGKYTDDLRRKL